MSELLFYEANGLRYFHMSEIEVDGVYRNSGHDIYSSPIVSFKDDYLNPIAKQWVDEADLVWLDDTNEEVIWSGMYDGRPYKYGDMDEDLWLKHGAIVGKNGDPDRFLYDNDI